MFVFVSRCLGKVLPESDLVVTKQTDLNVRRQPKQERAVKKRAQILAGALSALAESGAENLNMREVSRLANVGLGTVYDYFPSRSDLLCEVAQNWLEKRLSVFDGALEKTPASGNFHDFVRVYRRAMYEAGFWSVMDSEVHAAAKNDEKVGEVLRTYRESLTTRISVVLKQVGSQWTNTQLRPLSHFVLNLIDQLEPGATFVGSRADRKIVRRLITQSIAATIKLSLKPYSNNEGE